MEKFFGLSAISTNRAHSNKSDDILPTIYSDKELKYSPPMSTIQEPSDHNMTDEHSKAQMMQARRASPSRASEEVDLDAEVEDLMRSLKEQDHPNRFSTKHKTKKARKTIRKKDQAKTATSSIEEFEDMLAEFPD